MKVPLTVIIPTKNEAANLPRCLASVAWAAQIFVVDSQSDDDTAALARAHGAEVVQFHYAGGWPKKKNWALDHLPFAHDWVFILDADEVLPPQAEEELRRIVTAPSPEYCGYWINRRLHFLGRWLRHAYYPNWNLRLFQHKLGRYEQLTRADTASGDNEIHEHVVVPGATGRLECELDHYAFPSVEVFVEKHNRYSNWEARVARWPDPHQRPNPTLPHVRWRRWLRLMARHLPGRPTLRFLYVYLFQLGFLDGRPGYYLARLHAFYEFLSVAKTFELQQTAPRLAQPNPEPDPQTSPGQSGKNSLIGPLFLGWSLAVLFFVLRPANQVVRTDGIPAPVAGWINQHDQTSNCLAFFVLAALLFCLQTGPGSKTGKTRPAWLTAVPQSRSCRLACFCAFVVLLESAQLLIPGRVFDWKDILAGWSGGTIAALLWWLSAKTKRRSDPPLPTTPAREPNALV